jgi:hypothetical protein
MTKAKPVNIASRPLRGNEQDGVSMSVSPVDDRFRTLVRRKTL